jgi:hypothetical protein
VRVPQGLAPGCPVRERLASRLFFTLARRALVGWATAVLSLVREHTGRNRSRCRCATEGATPYFPRYQARLDPRQYWRRNIKLRTARGSARGSVGSGAGFRCFAAGLRDQQQQNGLVLEPVTLEDILALSALPALHRHPFDSLIIAQGNRGGFHLVTHDPV